MDLTPQEFDALFLKAQHILRRLDYLDMYVDIGPPIEQRSAMRYLPGWLRRLLTRAAPTCSLWEPHPNPNLAVVLFRPWPAFYLTREQIVECK